MNEKRHEEMNFEEVMLTGFARLPEKSVLFSKYNGAIGITLIVKRQSGEIVDIVSDDFSASHIEYFRKLLCGEQIMDDKGMEKIEELLARNFQSSLRKPFYSGIRAYKQKFEELREDDIKRKILESEENF